MHWSALRSLVVTLLLTIACCAVSPAEPVAVRHKQGAFHAFVVVKTLEGKRLAVGDYVQSVHGMRVNSRLTYHFKDGSLDDETSVFTQQQNFRLISDHHIQRGPSFPTPSDVFIDALSGTVTYRTEKGELTKDHLDMPADVANGMPPLLAMNLPVSIAEAKVSYVAPTAKPRMVHLSMKRGATVHFTIGGVQRQGIDWVIHVEIGGLIGAIAPMIGKQPADYHIWVLGGDAPAFIREEGQFYDGGPVWRVEQLSPTFDR